MITAAGVETIIREHGRRNFLLREQGLLSIVCPINDGSGIAGVGFFNAGIDEVRASKPVFSCTKTIRHGVSPVIVCRSDVSLVGAGKPTPLAPPPPR
jgi:hypothetical protein